MCLFVSGPLLHQIEAKSGGRYGTPVAVIGFGLDRMLCHNVASPWSTDSFARCPGLGWGATAREPLPRLELCDFVAATSYKHHDRVLSLA